MRTRLVLAVPVILAAAGSAMAQGSAVPPSAASDGRFVLRDTPDGLLRMDSRTGAMSLCTRSGGSLACRLVPDDRAALEQEIERLKAENEALKKGGTAAVRPADPGQSLTLPSDQEVDRALSLAERIWRRLRSMIRESETDTPADRRL
jgi:squalene cyclase